MGGGVVLSRGYCYGHSKQLRPSTVEMVERRHQTGVFSEPEGLHRLVMLYARWEEPIPLCWIRVLETTPYRIDDYRLLSPGWCVVVHHNTRGRRWLEEKSEDVVLVLAQLPGKHRHIRGVHGIRSKAMLVWAWKHGFVHVDGGGYRWTGSGRRLIQERD